MATTRKTSSSKRTRTPKGEGGKGGRAARAKVVAEPMDEALVVEPVDEVPIEPALETESMPVVVIPEPSFASRVTPPQPAPPPPPNRRAVFFDVEPSPRVNRARSANYPFGMNARSEAIGRSCQSRAAAVFTPEKEKSYPPLRRARGKLIVAGLPE